MKISMFLMLSACGLAVLCLAGPRSDKWPVREQETIEKTLSLAGGTGRLVVDNVDGYVHVTGIEGSSVRVKAHKIVRAETDNDWTEAKSEVKLAISEKPGQVSVYYDAPWRCNGSGQGCSGEHRRFYNVTYDIDVEVPRNARAVVSTVSGDVRLEGVNGDFDTGSVNGSIALAGMGGSGDAHTVNGPVSVHFSKNPAGPCSFKSVNGSLDVFFRQELSADLAFKTLNGEAYSDFEVTERPTPAAVQTEHRNGKFVYHSDKLRGGRAGRGGPELSFNTINGSIRLHREQ